MKYPTDMGLLQEHKRCGHSQNEVVRGNDSLACANDLLTRWIYFEKPTMEEIIKLEFNPGAAMAYFNNAKRGISILIICPRHGNETTDIRSKEHAMKLTEKH